MNPEQLQEIKDVVSKATQEGIDRNVNGKINTLTTEFRAHVTADEEWKKEYNPYLKAIANVSIAGKILIGTAIAGAAILEFFTRITKLFK